MSCERVLAGIEHHPAKLEAADPFPLVVAALLQSVGALLEQQEFPDRRAVRRLEDIQADFLHCDRLEFQFQT